MINIKMNDKTLNESLNFHDMEGQIIPLLTVDEYAAKMGSNSDIVTLAFIVKNELAGKDLVNWFEKGYDYILDSQISEGELETNRWLVFVELNRRSTIPNRIIELLTDLKTLTGLNLTEWTIQIDEEDYEPEEQILKQVIICNPNEYKIKKEKEDELNEMRNRAGLESKKIFTVDKEIKDFVSKAGL